MNLSYLTTHFGTNQMYFSLSDPECLIYILIIIVLIYYFIEHSDVFSFTFGDLPSKEWQITRNLLYASFLLMFTAFFTLTLDRSAYGAALGLTFVFSAIAILFIISRLPHRGLIDGDVYHLLFKTIAFTVVISTLITASRADTPALWSAFLLSLFLSLWFIYDTSFFKGKYIRFTRKRNADEILMEKLGENGYEVHLQKRAIKHSFLIKVKTLLDLPKEDIQLYISDGMIIFSKTQIYNDEMEEILSIIDKEIT